MQLKKRLLRFSPNSTTTTTTTTQPPPPQKALFSTRAPLETADLATRFGTHHNHIGRGHDGVVSAFRRASDGALFAVKQYRPRRASESKDAYHATLTAEYGICHDLSHGNIIKIHDLVSENGAWYQVMECAPFDLFSAVMQGGMGSAEADCCFRQVVEGVRFLHGAGIAHRDLKLDNIVVTREGIMKIIDFGSAMRFRCKVTGNVIAAQGIAGSMPYLAPEVFNPRPYDPRAADIWSLAIIYYTLVTRRMPWKVARVSDLSYARFTGTVIVQSAAPPPPQAQRASEQIKLVVTRNAASVAPPTSRRASAVETAGIKSRSNATSSATPGSSVMLLLPVASRPLMSHMLAVNPVGRAAMEDLTADAWLNGIRFCKEDAETGLTTRCAGEDEEGREGHVHTLVRAVA